MSEKIDHSKKGRLGRGLGSLLGGSPMNTSLSTDVKPPSQISSLSTGNPQSTPISTKITTNVAPPTPQQPVVVQQSNPLKKEQEAQTNVAPAQPVVPHEARIWKIAVDKLHPNEFQPRQKFNKESIQELANSIKQKGILQPIVARRHQTGQMEIISGERRWRAAQVAGLHEVPVILRTVTDQDSLELAIIENVQREDLNPMDEAEAYQRLAKEFNLTQLQIAEKVGKERATVANAMRLLSLPLQVREFVANGQLSPGHAKAIMSVGDSLQQIKLAKKIVAEKLSVRVIEKLVAKIAGGDSSDLDGVAPKVDEKSATKKRLVESLSMELQRIVGTKCTIDYNQGKGKIVFAFYSDEELNEISDKIKAAWQKK